MATGSRCLVYVVAATFYHFASLSTTLLPTLPLNVRHLGGSTYQVGLVIGILALTHWRRGPSSGSGWDRAGRRELLLAGPGSTYWRPWGTRAILSISWLLVWRVFHAIGLAAFSTVAASLAADLAPPGRRGATMGVFGPAPAAALTVGPGIRRSLLGALGYPGVFVTS